ncbi:MAG: hypothetical protein E7E72_03090 [Clostridium sp.]|nr:hypothetical protein [Clostridium sp.]
MDIRILKLSNEKGASDSLSSRDILSIHLGYFLMNGKVTYSTGIPIANKPDYVLLTLGNIENICYLCHVENHDYKGRDIFFSFVYEVFKDNAPDKYKDSENISWLLLDSIQKIPTDFLDEIHSNQKITDFIKDRANNKSI